MEAKQNNLIDRDQIEGLVPLIEFVDTLDTYIATEVFAKQQTKDEIDSRVEEKYRVWENVATKEDLPLLENKIGDVRGIEDSPIKYVWVGGLNGSLGNGWDVFGGADMGDITDMPEITELLSGKVDKVDGKGLSTLDYTVAEQKQLKEAVSIKDAQSIEGIKTFKDPVILKESTDTPNTSLTIVSEGGDVKTTVNKQSVIFRNGSGFYFMRVYLDSLNLATPKSVGSNESTAKIKILVGDDTTDNVRTVEISGRAYYSGRTRLGTNDFEASDLVPKYYVDAIASNLRFDKSVTQSVSGNYMVRMNEYVNQHILTLTGNTTVSFNNMITDVQSTVITLSVDGVFAFNLPVWLKPAPNNDVYDGAKYNKIVINIERGGASPMGYYTLMNIPK